ncbi:MAG: efflux transporter periplasmic adaptor subunit, partial [Gammaproteobacteria bacterium]|nr:efflux transporter periplasmic adaptor subunit [Gammaproteobacteria bacterium]
MKLSFKHIGRPLMVAGGLVVGVGLLALLMINRQVPMHGETGPSVPVLAVIEVQAVDFLLEARGHGVSRAAHFWQASANVPGRVVEQHPQLESGALLPEGTLLLALDPSRYQLAIVELEAEMASLSAERAMLGTENDNTRRLLKLEKERLALSEQELSRIEQLLESNSVSRSVRDEQYRATVAQRQSVVKLENELTLLPARRDYVDAQLERAAIRLQQAKEDLADTRFVAPYDLRISEVEIDLHQHAAVGQRLFRADSIEAAEIEAHIPLSMLRRLMGNVPRTALSAEALDISEWPDFSVIGAEVRLAETLNTSWPARVTRIASGLDLTTRTARVVVTVDAPYKNVAPPERPALQPGMYLQVRLTVKSREPRLVVPSTAVHNNEVYRVVDDRLERSPVSVA